MAGGTEKGGEEEEGKMRIDGSGESTLYHGIKKNQRRLAMFWIIARDGSFFLFVNVCVCASKREKGREREMMGNGLLVFGRLCEHIMLF